jgi:hypothetical protein
MAAIVVMFIRFCIRNRVQNLKVGKNACGKLYALLYGLRLFNLVDSTL